MQDLTARLHEDPNFAAAFEAAERDYVSHRDKLAKLEAGGGIGGGPSDRVKCLHAHLAHHLVCRCNPVGEWVEERIGDAFRAPPCV